MSIGPVHGAPPLSSPHLAEPIEGALPYAAGPGDAPSAIGQSFLDLVIQANASGRLAGQMGKKLALGQSDDIHGTMIAMNISGIEKRLAVNIKDKVIDAFYEIWRMSL